MGYLTQDHLRAVACLALTSCGFVLPSDAYRTEIRDLNDAGESAFNCLVSECSDVFEIVQQLRARDDFLPDRLTKLLGLGSRQALVLSSSATQAFRANDDPILLSAFFNTAIVVFDYIVDQDPTKPDVSTIISGKLISGIFFSEDGGIPAIIALAKRQSNLHIKLFLLLMASCAARGIAIKKKYRNEVVWSRLAVLVERLFCAHSALAQTRAQKLPNMAVLALEKSSLPSLISLTICQLADDSIQIAQVDSAETLGHLFSLIDDLADIVSDLENGEPNTIIIALEGAEYLCDADLYDCCVKSAAKIMQLLDKIDSVKIRHFAAAIVGMWLNWSIESTYSAKARGNNTLLESSVDSLLHEQINGYAEATHWLRFPRLDLSFETHPANLAQRTVVLDALLDARNIGIDIPQTIVAVETLAILQSKHRSVRSGWNYVPTVPELPPDADDVGQVLQALVRVGGSCLASTCDEAVRILLDSIYPDGGINTWIIDPRGRNLSDEKVHAYLPVMGGWGVHTEVVANFAYGIWLYDRNRFAEPLQQIANYLITAQNNDGHWDSHWYAGPYYGTFKVLTVLAVITPRHPAIGSALNFLRGCQHSDGSWDQSPLSTALAILSLLQIDDPLDMERLFVATRALNAMACNGVWKPQPWIEFNTIDGVETFKSSTITTAFCVKALSAFVHRFGHQMLRDLLKEN